jgi:hypothetical protein
MDGMTSDERATVRRFLEGMQKQSVAQPLETDGVD